MAGGLDRSGCEGSDEGTVRLDTSPAFLLVELRRDETGRDGTRQDATGQDTTGRRCASVFQSMESRGAVVSEGDGWSVFSLAAHRTGRQAVFPGWVG
jgi:hypothetical protein